MTLMPWVRRQLAEPLHAIKTGSPRLRIWMDLEETQYFSETELRKNQWHCLEKLLHHAWEHNDYYRRRFESAGLHLRDIQSPADLHRIPVLTKEEIRSNTMAMISRCFDASTLQHAKTGGSTGKALELFFTEKCSELRNACARRHDRWTGWEPGEPIAACWGNPNVPKNLSEKLKKWLLQPMMYLDTMSISSASLSDFVEDWHRIKPTLLYGHAHSIFVLSQHLKEMGVCELKPNGILSTSMMLIPSERKVIEKLFGVGVIDRYGCEEVGLIGCECERHEGMHLNIEHLFIEFLRDDGTQAASGEPGKIVVTDLINHAMPIIRYQVEDVGVPTDRKCSCGRGLPMMESVTGRVADFLLKKDGSKVAGVSLIENTLTRLPGINQMQIIQNDYNHFEIRLVISKHFDSLVGSDLVAYFKALFGSDVTIDLLTVPAILPEKSGKFRFSICNIR